MASPARQRLTPELPPITVDWGLAFTQPSTQKGLSYWRSICRGRSMPSRRDLSPREMREFITHVGVVDVLADAAHRFEFRVSLQGTHAREVLGHVAGGKLGEVLPETIAARWRHCFGLARDAAAPVRILTRATTARKDWLACEALVAPLGENGPQALFWVFAAWLPDDVQK